MLENKSSKCDYLDIYTHLQLELDERCDKKNEVVIDNILLGSKSDTKREGVN